MSKAQLEVIAGLRVELETAQKRIAELEERASSAICCWCGSLVPAAGDQVLAHVRSCTARTDAAELALRQAEAERDVAWGNLELANDGHAVEMGELRAEVERLKTEAKERQRTLEVSLEERESAFAERNWANERHDEARAEVERLRDTVRKREQEHLEACAEADEARAEVERLRERLQIDPGGSDRIDELEDAAKCAQFTLQRLRAEVEKLRTQLRDVAEALKAQAGDTPGPDSRPCWCNEEDCRCRNRPWCVQARAAIAKTEGES